MTATTTITVPQIGFGAALHNAYLAASRDQSRPIITGAYLERHPTNHNILYVTATDTYRLVRTAVCCRENIGDDFQPVILGDLKAAANYVKKIKTTEIAVTVTAQDVTVTTSDAVRTFPTIDGQYPNYKPLIPAVDPTINPTGFPAFNPSFLADAGKLVHPDVGWTAAHRKRYGIQPGQQSGKPLQLHYTEPLKPAFWTYDTYGTNDPSHAPVLYLLMPVRIR